MSKITFRADDDLVDELEAFDASKSEVMRDALRTYLDGHANDEGGVRAEPRSSDDADETESALAEAVDSLVRERVNDHLERQLSERRPSDGGEQDVNVTVSLEGREEAGPARQTRDSTPRANAVVDAPAESGSHQCGGCGTSLESGHVYCPNCGEKASQRVFCECGDEVRSDWSFCPGCGRRTPAADVLEPR